MAITTSASLAKRMAVIRRTLQERQRRAAQAVGDTVLAALDADAVLSGKVVALVGTLPAAIRRDVEHFWPAAKRPPEPAKPASSAPPARVRAGRLTPSPAPGQPAKPSAAAEH